MQAFLHLRFLYELSYCERWCWDSFNDSERLPLWFGVEVHLLVLRSEARLESLLVSGTGDPGPWLTCLCCVCSNISEIAH